MTTTYRNLLPVLLIPLFVGLAPSQSLEDKVSQARRLQAQSAIGMDQAAIDSLIAEKKAARGPDSKSNQKRPGVSEDEAILDSLISSPMDLDSAVMYGNDSAFGDSKPGDSLRSPRKKRSGKPAIPKRYEQRIFRSVDRSAFSGTRSAVGRDYVLGPGDAINLSLWGDKEKEYDLILNAEGKVFLEGAGLIPLTGSNLAEAEKRIRERLARIYSGITRGTVHVDVSLGRVGPIKVFLLGEVKLPGGFVFTGHTSVLSAMYFAQGPTDIGTVRDLQLTRAGQKYPLDLYKYLLKGERLTPDVLQDGDIIFSGRAHALVEVTGDVGRPATYELRAGEGIKELLEFAGGANPTAASQKITLQRIFKGGGRDYIDLSSPEDYVSGKLKAELQDGDRVTVEKSTEMGKYFLTVIGPVKYPGTYSSEGITTVAQLVTKAGGLREDAFLGRVHVVRFRPDGSSSLMAYSLDSTRTDVIPLEPRDNIILYSLKDMHTPDSVEVVGAVFNPGKYEFRAGMSAVNLIMQAGGFLPHHESGKVLVFRGDVHERKVEQITLSTEPDYTDSNQVYPLRANDLVQVPTDPRWYKKEVVTMEGLFMRPGKYALLYPGEPIHSVVARAGGFKINAYVEGGRFFRSKDSVGRIGVDIRKAMDRTRSKANIAMMGGDSIFIPERLNTIKVIGEVGFETSVLFSPGAAVQYYIEKAGGFTRHSEKNRVVVQYANGETSRDGYFNRKPDAGSVIYVPQGPEPQAFNWVGGINVLLGTFTAAVTLLLLTNQLTSD